MLEQLKQILSQAKNFYLELSREQKISIFLGIFLIALTLSIFIFTKPTLIYETAFTNLTAEDKTAILAQLKKNNIKNFKLEGETLLFPVQDMLDIKMALAQEGLPSSGSGVGWERFDQKEFGMSDFDQRIHKLRALQGELSRTINRLEPIAASRVHLVIPDKGFFADENHKPSASLYLKLKPGKTLTERQIQGIVHFVAGAVEGLDTNEVSLVDQNGNMLTADDKKQGLNEETNAQRNYQKEVEKELETKIREIITPIVGEDKVIPKVQLDMDFKKVETTISDIDPERTAVISSQRNEQSFLGGSQNPTGIPGAKSNLPGETEASGNKNLNTTKANTESTNFEVKKTLSRIIEPVGDITKMSVSVLVDGKIVQGKFVQRSPEEIAMITKLVKNAIGYQENRDSLTVESTRFEPSEFQIATQEASENEKKYWLKIGIFTSSILAFLIFIYFAIVRPYIRWLTFEPRPKPLIQVPREEYNLEKTGTSLRKPVSQENEETNSIKNQVLQFAKSDPKKITEVLRQILNQHRP